MTSETQGNMPLSAVLTEDKVKDLLRKYGIPTPKYRLIEYANEIPSLELKFPVVLKVCSPHILHKTEVGGVVLGLADKESLADELAEMRETFPGEKFLVEEMAEKGLEVIVGLVNDQTFGLCLMVGLGGIFTEIFEDVSLRAVPISRGDAIKMLNELKSSNAFDGFRGMKINKDSIVELLQKVSQLAMDHREKIDQLDLNPVIIRADGLSVVDAKLILKATEAPIEKRPAKAKAEFLRSLFYPESIAVIGATANPEKDGFRLLKNIIEGRFSGPIYPINPNDSEILGLPAKKSVLEIEGRVDLVAIVIAARLIPPVLEECGKKGIKNVLIISSGFQEIGSEGIRIAAEIKELLDKYGMRAIGPNCQGLVNTHHRLYAALGMESHSLAVKKGGIGIISQSGSVGIDLVQRTLDEKLGFSLWINTGNKLDVNESDIIRYMDNDPNVSVIAAYLEDIKDGALFLETIHSLKKPLIILKSGRTEAGKRAARSHTAALAGNDRIVDGIFRQFKVCRAETTDELFDLAKAFSLLTPPRGRRLMIVESSGGIGTLASDIAEKSGLELPDLDEGSKDKMRRILPSYLKPQNPVDLGTQFGSQFSRVAEAKILDHYDALLILFADPILDAAAAVQAFQKNSDKPIVVAFSGGGKIQKNETAKIRRLGIPIYPNVERALKFFALCAGHGNTW